MADIIYPGAPAGGPINAGAMPKNYDISIYEGDTFQFTLTVKDASNVAVNLTGYTAKAQLKKSFDDASPIDFTCVISTPTSGVVNISLPASTTADLIAGDTYIYDVQLTAPNGNVRTYLAGDAIVIPEVTT